MMEWSSAWKAYFAEIDPAKRRELFASLPEEPAKALAADLLNRRYVRRGDLEVDRFFACMMEFMGIARSGGPAGNIRKTARSYMEELGFFSLAGEGELGEELLRMEAGNAVLRYLDTCSDAAYGRKLFGLMASTEEEKRLLAAKDIRSACDGFAERLGNIDAEDLKAALSLYCRGMREAYLNTSPKARELYERAGAKR